MDSFNVSFEWQGSSAVRVLDFNEMEYDNENSSDPSFLELQNAGVAEILVESTNDQYNQSEISDNTSSIPSYGSFVENLTRSQNDSFENATNSTRIEDISAPETSGNIMNKCAFNCATCLQIYDDNETEEPINVTMLEDINITNNNLSYCDLTYILNQTENLTYILNQTESTTYMTLPQYLSVSNDNVRLRLRNKILAKSNAEANATTGSCFYGIVPNS